MYSWVSTEFRRHGILPLTRIPLLTRISSVDMELPCQHGIPPSTRNSPIDTEFRQHGIPLTRNSVDMEFHQHKIPPTRNSAFFLLPYIQYAILCYLFLSQLWRDSVYKNTQGSVEFCRISRILRASLYNMYEFEYLKVQSHQILHFILGFVKLNQYFL